MAIWAHQRPLIAEAAGAANLETSSPVTAATIFRIGSLTKQFTAAAIFKLGEQGKLRIDGPVSDYLPAFKRLPPLTLLELMTHTAGLHSEEAEGTTSAAQASVKSQIELANAVAAQLKPLDFSPGAAWLYSNANYIVLGAVVEQVTRAPLREALSGLVLRPLNLSSTAMDRSSDVVKGRASGYTPNDGRPGFTNAEFIEVADAGGAGGMRSTASDLCRWHYALLSGQFLTPKSLALMTAPGLLRDGRVSGANRFSAGDSNYGDVQYACGLLVHNDGYKGRVVTHNGFINGFSAVLESHVDRSLTFAVLCNADVNPALPFRAIRRSLLEQHVS